MPIVPSGREFLEPVKLAAMSPRLTKQNAERLKMQILNYWRSRGWETVRVWLTADIACAHPEGKRQVDAIAARNRPMESEEIWVVRSNLGPDGLPPRRLAKTSGMERAA